MGYPRLGRLVGRREEERVSGGRDSYIFHDYIVG